MCGLSSCAQITIAFFVVLYLQSVVFFGGCIFFGYIKYMLFGYMLLMNLVTLITFGVDKQLARENHQSVIRIPFFMDYDGHDLQETFTNVFHRKTRVAELVLIFLMFSGGILGAWIAMLISWHKIKKKSFVVKAIFVSVINLLWFIIWLIVDTEKNLLFCKTN